MQISVEPGAREGIGEPTARDSHKALDTQTIGGAFEPPPPRRDRRAEQGAREILLRRRVEKRIAGKIIQTPTGSISLYRGRR